MNQIDDSSAAAVSEASAKCFHCGERCADLQFNKDDKSFCCNGCLVVHDLLTENGLGHFYDLNHSPGTRMRRPSKAEQFACLDEPDVQRQLLDFTDEKTSHVTFQIPAIHCIACVWLLENLFQLNPGIGLSRVNFAKREVAIAFVPQKIKLSELVELLVSIGYEPSLTLGKLEPRKLDRAGRRRWLQMGVAGFAFGNIMLLSVPRYFGLRGASEPQLQMAFGWLSLALALPVLIFSASDYWKSALLMARQRMLTLDVPIALGLAALYSQSAYEILFRHGGGYLDSMTGLVFFLLCGRAFQQKINERLTFDLDYKSFFPLSATRKTDPGIEEHVSISTLKTGDRLIVRNGELIPADATLLAGAASIDYSFVTGESEPVAKREGDYLYAGGRQTGAAIEIETVKPVSQSYLTSLWNHAAFRKNRENNFNSLTNRYSRRFTRIVVGIALVAALFWVFKGDWPRGLKAFTSVLIVACPCALALAAPFALGTAQRWLARMKIFLKNSLILERLADANVIVFDKTGTLTTASGAQVSFSGKPLTAMEKDLIHSVAWHSTHPLAVRIAKSIRAGAVLTVEGFKESSGNGIRGIISGKQILLGSPNWLAEQGIQIPQTFSAGGSIVCAAIDGEFCGAFTLVSNVRPEMEKLLRQLECGHEMVLLSGDNEREREKFRKLFGDRSELRFNQNPFDKLEFIRRLQSKGKTVVMVGDGLNDAGALQQSDVGVAVVEKIGVFSPASDVILESSQLGRLAEILRLARHGVRIVKISFGISVVYNLVGVGIAAAGVLSPVICALLMPASSISVMLFACGVTTWAARRSKLHLNPEVQP
ncbi:MAG TPA: heavy metal translocating P-type ATPase metal-binding domain-containing protein [Verrucomicrobiae bacterium]|nr:heavy metal translocating P-type ATPase metal-binding domain-containing protein [Verrucomicrobiae bacterium]